MIDYQCVARKKWCRNRADGAVNGAWGEGEERGDVIAWFCRMALKLRCEIIGND